MRFPKPSPSSFKRIRTALWPLVVTVIGGIIVHVYVNRVALEMQLLAQSTIVEGAGHLEKLQVSYDKRQIPALSSLELQLVNTGHVPIQSAEMVEPVEVAVDSGRIMDVRTDEVTRPKAKVAITVDTTGKRATLVAPLLNPGESVRFTILVDHTPPPAIRVTGRAPRLGPIAFVDRRIRRSVWGSLGWLVYVIASGTMAAFIALVWFSYRGGYARNQRHQWRGRSYVLPNSLTAAQFMQFLDVVWGDPALDSKVRQTLAGIPESKVIPQSQLNVANETVEKYIRDLRILGNRILLVLLFILAVGGVYVTYSLINAARRGGG